MKTFPYDSKSVLLTIDAQYSFFWHRRLYLHPKHLNMRKQMKRRETIDVRKGRMKKVLVLNICVYLQKMKVNYVSFPLQKRF